MSPIEPRQHAHELIERMSSNQVSAVVNLLEVMLDPHARTLENIPFEDELISEEEESQVAASKAWLQVNKGISNEEVLAELGLASENFEHMGRTPLEG